MGLRAGACHEGEFLPTRARPRCECRFTRPWRAGVFRPIRVCERGECRSRPPGSAAGRRGRRPRAGARNRWSSRAIVSPEGSGPWSSPSSGSAACSSSLDERLDVGIALHRQVDLAVVVGGGPLQIRGVDRDLHEALSFAHEGERGLSGWARRRCSQAPPPTGSANRPSPVSWQAACSTPTIRLGPRTRIGSAQGAPPVPRRSPSR